MKAVIYLLAALLLGTALVALYSKMSAVNNTISSPAVSHRPELEYLMAVNSVAPPHLLRERHRGDAGASQAAFRRASLRGELDRRCRPCSAPKPLPSGESGRGRVGLVRDECRQGASCGVAAGGLLSAGKTRSRRRRSSQGTRLPTPQRIQEFRPPDYAHHSFFGGPSNRPRFCAPAHSRDPSRPRLRALRF